MHKSRVHRPDSAHRCTVNLVRSCQAPVITHMQLRLQKIYSIIASKPRKMRIMRKQSEAKHSPSLNYRHRLFCLALICSFTAKDKRSCAHVSVFHSKSNYLRANINKLFRLSKHLLQRETRHFFLFTRRIASREDVPLSPRENGEVWPAKISHAGERTAGRHS